jgi:two-component system response regulator YesN
MYRMILADDEVVITRGLKLLLDWDSLGIQIAAVCSDGEKAMKAILQEKPDIAILDISMPGLDGIQILKNIHELKLPTKVILLSGFQDFSYARNALSFGAVDYLLKPVIKDELLAAVGKALGAPQAAGNVRIDAKESRSAEKDGQGRVSGGEDSGGTSGTSLPALAAWLPERSVGVQEQKLMEFVYFGNLKQAADGSKDLLHFAQDGDVMLILKDADRNRAKKRLTGLGEEAGQALQGRPVFLVGKPIKSLEGLASAWKDCRGRKSLLYFLGTADETVIFPETGEEDYGSALEGLSRLRERMIGNLIAVREEAFERDYEQFARVLARAAAGKKEDACYYFCSTVRTVEERLRELNIPGLGPDTKELMERARSFPDFEGLKAYFREILTGYFTRIREGMGEAGKKNIRSICEYIDRHYRENLTLEVMAKEFFMNPYYFSSYFKKQTGTGFKEYLSYIRIQHAISLLLTTDMKTYEIAAEVGFPDARSFSDAFVKKYGETPSVYKKRILTQGE